MNLLNDVARCNGVYSSCVGIRSYHNQCENYLRRTAQQTDRRGTTVAYMTPPEFIDGKCPERIDGSKP